MQTELGKTGRATPPWVWPLVSTLGIQATQSFVGRLVPTLAPVLTAAAGMRAESIGTMAAVGTVGSILFLTVGLPFIRKHGPIRSLQGGLALCGIGLAILVYPTPWVVYLANVLIGVGYGPSAPAGSDILLRHAPAAHRTLIFSLKQAGVPVGGVAAGLVLPWLVSMMDWRIAVLLLACVPLLTIAAVQPIREEVDAERNPDEPTDLRVLLSAGNLLGPLRMVVGLPELRGLTIAGAGFAITQGSLFAFTVTWLVGVLHYDLAKAGLVFAVMQATGIVGRVALGWVSDRTSGLGTLLLNALAGAATLVCFSLVTPATAFSTVLVLAGLSGLTCTSWNGVQLAEIARLSPKGRVGETTGGATVITFIGYVVGPAGFAAVLAATGSYPAAFLCVAAVLCASFVALLQARRAAVA